MIIDDAVIAKIAKLSSLEVDESKIDSLKKELGEIVTFVENLNEIDVSGVDATFTTLNGGSYLRDDVAVVDLELARDIISKAPKSEDNYFVVPKIIE